MAKSPHSIFRRCNQQSLQPWRNPHAKWCQPSPSWLSPSPVSPSPPPRRRPPGEGRRSTCSRPRCASPTTAWKIPTSTTTGCSPPCSAGRLLLLWYELHCSHHFASSFFFFFWRWSPFFAWSVEAAQSVTYETYPGTFSAFLTNNQARRLSSEWNSYRYSSKFSNRVDDLLDYWCMHNLFVISFDRSTGGAGS